MATNKFKKHLWLLNTIRSFGPISYENINRLWLRSSLNDLGGELSKKTFHNHLNAIAYTFDIEILCDRKSGYLYYIGDTLSSDKWTQNYLNSLLFQFSLLDDENMKSVVYDIDNEHDTDDRIYFIMGCIKNHLVISFTYHRSYALLRETEPNMDVPDEIRMHTNFAPLGLVHTDRTWFVIGMDINTNKAAPIQLNRMESLTVMEDLSYIPSEKFYVRDYVDELYSSYDISDSLTHKDDDAFDLYNAIQFSSFATHN